ncbi:hypothetical protein OIU77_002123 [Salix suchowensis]|uniref:Uncharacterized protein n=1 Tax=Salix suchowensis TaxID=1278906 RepID=A0ABQ9B3P7_9ROSI|nr:hypothetical protein OIU77_002123 [Salix suchowensis]
MDIKVLVQEGAEIAQPFLENALQKPAKTPGQKAMRKTFKGTAHLARLLPTGSVLAFQILSPVLTHEGQCRSITSQTMTLVSSSPVRPGLLSPVLHRQLQGRARQGPVWDGDVQRVVDYGFSGGTLAGGGC